MIRTYQASDTETILDTWYQATTLAHPFMKEAFLEKDKNNIREIYLPNTLTWVFEKDDQLVGFISMMKNEVAAIFVRPEFHGQAIGTQLLNLVAEKHEELEVEVFEENVIGRSFYKKYGFQFKKRHLHEPTNQFLLRLKYSRP
jgi:putative acetyltransferase